MVKQGDLSCTLTSVCGIISEIEAREQASVDQGASDAKAMSAIGAKKLLLRQLNWESFFASANPPGALPPQSAKLSLTRQAIRRKEARRKAQRQGLSGLKRAIA